MVDGAPTFGPAEPLFGDLRLGERVVSFSRDGKRVLAAIPVGQRGPSLVTLVQNWPATVGLE